MANLYVRSTDGSDADNGSTWALAKATLTGAAAIDAAGDRIYVSNSHAESTASAVTITLNGTQASPVWVVGVSDAAEPPTAVSTAPTVTTTGTSGLSLGGGYAYWYGINFYCGTGAGNPVLGITGQYQYLQNCTLRLLAGSTSRIGALEADEQYTEWRNVDVSFSNASQGIALSRAGIFFWRGGSVLSGSTAQTTLLTVVGGTTRGGIVLIEGVDLSNLGASANLVSNAFAGAWQIVFRNCKLPASWSGSLCPSLTETAAIVQMWNCDSGDTNYRMFLQGLSGSVAQETTIVRTGGASDGTTPIAWKMVTNANAEYPLLTLNSPEIVIWNDAVGSSKTVTIEIITDNVTLTDAECWLDVQCLGTSGFPLGVLANDAKADVLATAANQTSSSETWTTTGLATPVKQKLSVTFTPQEKGYIHAVVKLARASATVYVDPKITVT